MQKVMTENVIIAKPEADLEQIAAVMLIEHLKVIPVVDNKRVVGLIKRSDIIEQMAKNLLNNTGNLRACIAVKACRSFRLGE